MMNKRPLYLILNESDDPKDVDEKLHTGVPCLAYRDEPKHGAIKYFANPYVPKEDLDNLTIRYETLKESHRSVKEQLVAAKQELAKLKGEKK